MSQSRHKHAPTAHARGRKKRAWDRHPEDWYVEEDWIDDRLFAEEQFDGPVHDPACGGGRIVRAARRAGLKATGSDIVQRAVGFALGDFFERTRPIVNLASNPPFRFLMAFIAHALALTEKKVAIVVPTAWLNADNRSRWLEHRTPLRKIWLLTPRPSMPPGNVAAMRKISNGTTDYAWLIFEHGFTGKYEWGWLRRDDAPEPIEAE